VISARAFSASSSLPLESVDVRDADMVGSFTADFFFFCYGGEGGLDDASGLAGM
jgi:hypothetical protein